MNVLSKFKDLFLEVWKDGVSGINITEIIIAISIFGFFLFLRGIFSKFVVKRLEVLGQFVVLVKNVSTIDQFDTLVFVVSQ